MLAGGVVLTISLVGTVAVALIRLGQRPARMAGDVGIAGAIAVAGLAIAYGVLVAAMYLRGGFLGGASALIAIYVAYVVVVGIGLGVALAERGQPSFAAARGMGAAAIAGGLAGTFALFLVPPILGRAIVIPGAWLLGILGVSTGTIAARVVLRLPLASAFGLAIGVAVGFGPFLLASLLFGFSGPATLTPPLPQVPWLPGTSTE